MILPDVNVLVHAYRVEAPEHDGCASWLTDVVNGEEDLGLLEAALVGFVRIVTHPRIFALPSPTVDALAFVDALRRAPVARALEGSDASWSRLGLLAASDRPLRGNLVPDGQIAAVALVHAARVATRARGRSDERRVGKECVGTCRDRGAPDH